MFSSDFIRLCTNRSRAIRNLLVRRCRSDRSSIFTVRLCPVWRTSEIQDRSEIPSMQRDWSSSGVRWRARIDDPGHDTHMLAWSSHQAWFNWWCSHAAHNLSLGNYTSAMAGMASWARGKDWPPYSVMLCSGGLGTQARQIMLRKPGAQQAPYTCTRMWDVAGPSNDRDPMHILRILLDCC